MHFVQHCAVRPHHCAVLPFVGNATSTKGFIDTGSELDGFDNHVYVSLEAVEEMARMIGWSSPSSVHDAERRAAQAEMRARLLDTEVQELRAFKKAYSTLTSQGADVKRRPGRPKKEPVA
jgi:hypothetical protein